MEMNQIMRVVMIYTIDYKIYIDYIDYIDYI